MRKRILLSCLCLSLIVGSMTGALAEEIGTEQVPAVVSDGGSTELPIPETPPAAPTVQSVTCRQIVLNPVEGCEYALIPTGGDVTGPVIWQQSPVFADIQVNTAYTVYQRLAATETHQASAASAGLAVIPKHTERSTVVAPTCTQKGYTKHVCTVCGNSETDSETPALGHEYKNTVIAPTCTAKGYTKHVCTRCGDSYSDGEKPALGHKMTKTAAKKATCTKAGNKEYWTCSRCKKVFRDAKGTQETTASKQKIKAIGHSYKTVTTKAKPGKNGRIRTTCKNCGRVKSSKTISRPSRIVLSRSSYAWDGSSHKPSVTVKNASGSTISSKNYRVSYPSNTRSAGKHTITVTFKGKKYSGRIVHHRRQEHIGEENSSLPTPLYIQRQGTSSDRHHFGTARGYRLYRELQRHGQRRHRNRAGDRKGELHGQCQQDLYNPPETERYSEADGTPAGILRPVEEGSRADQRI